MVLQYVGQKKKGARDQLDRLLPISCFGSRHCMWCREWKSMACMVGTPMCAIGKVCAHDMVAEHAAARTIVPARIYNQPLSARS